MELPEEGDVEPYQAQHNEFVIADEGVPVQLPEPVPDTRIIVKTVSGANTDVIAPPGFRLDGDTRKRFKDQYQALSLLSDGNSWVSKEQFGAPIDGVNTSNFVLSDLEARIETGDEEEPLTEPVEQGRLDQTVQITAQLFNGGTPGATDVSFILEDLPETEEETLQTTTIATQQDIALDVDETTEVSFSLTLTQDVGSYNIVLQAEDTEVRQAFEILPNATNIQVSNLTAPIDVSDGQQITASADLENTGEGATDIPIDLIVDGDVIETKTISEIQYQGTDSVSFNYTVDVLSNASTLAISSPQDSASQALDITFPNTLVLLQNDNLPSNSYPTEALTINVDANNLGPADTDVPIRLIRDQGEASETLIEEKLIDVTEEGSQTLTFNYTVDLPEGNYTLTLESPQDSITQSVAVFYPDTAYNVSNLSAPSQAIYGETITITADVENVGEPATDIPINLNVQEQELNRGIQSGDLLNPPNRTEETVTIDSLDIFETKTVTFNYRVNTADPESSFGVFAPQLRGNDYDGEAHFAVQNLTVESGIPDIVVRNLDAPSGALTNETINVTAELENIAQGALDIPIDLALEQNGTRVATLRTKNVDMLSGEVRNISFTRKIIQTAGSYDIGVFSDDGFDVQPFEIQFSDTQPLVQNLNAPGASYDGDQITVTADIFNIGEPATGVNVDLIIDEGQTSEQIVGSDTVDADYRTPTQASVTYNVDLDFGNYKIGMYTFADGKARGLSIPEPGVTLIEDAFVEGINDNEYDLSITEPAFVDDTVSVTAKAENAGAPLTDIPISLEVSGIGTVETKNVDFAFQETQNITFNYDTTGLEGGNRTFTVVGPNNSVSRTRDVRDVRPLVSSVNVPDRSYNGDTITISGQVSNSGKSSSNITIEFLAEPGTQSEQVLDTQIISLNYDTDTNVSYNYSVTESPGEYTFGIRSSFDGVSNYSTDSDTVSVNETTLEVSGFTFPDVQDVDQDITVSATVQNIGAPVTDASVRAIQDGQQQGEQLVSLNLNESTTVSFTYALEPIGDVAQVSIETDDDSESGVVAIKFNDFFVLVDNLDVPLVVDDNDDVTMSAELTNVGESGFGITIDPRFDIGGPNEGTITVDGTALSEDVALDADEVRTVSYSFNVSDLSRAETYGEYVIGVFSPNGSSTQSFTIEATGLTVSNLVGPDNVEVNGEFTISADVTNQQNEVFGEPVRVVSEKGTNDATILGAQELDFATDETKNVSFTVNADVAEGDRDIGIYTQDDGKSKIITVSSGVADFQPTITSGNIVESNFDASLQSTQVESFFGVSVTDTTELVSDFQPTITSGGVLQSTFEITQEGTESVGTFFGVSIEDTTELTDTYDATITSTEEERVETNITGTSTS